MKERPIIFSAPMVRALLDGRKTQTRRIVKPQPDPPRVIYTLDGADTVVTPTLLNCENGIGVAWQFAMTRIAEKTAPIAAVFNDFEPVRTLCPYGKPGDRLWVRESWRSTGDGGRCDAMPPRKMQPHTVWYESDGYQLIEECAGKLRPSIFMPRWASRITLEVTGVRVERLKDISEADAIAEGPAQHPDGPWHAYRSLWTLINGPGSWAANPWVWVIEFKVVKP